MDLSVIEIHLFEADEWEMTKYAVMIPVTKNVG